MTTVPRRIRGLSFDDPRRRAWRSRQRAKGYCPSGLREMGIVTRVVFCIRASGHAGAHRAIVADLDRSLAGDATRILEWFGPFDDGGSTQRIAGEWVNR